MKLTRKEKEIIRGLKEGGILITGHHPQVGFKDGRQPILFTFAKFCDLQHKGVLKPWNGDFHLCV